MCWRKVYSRQSVGLVLGQHRRRLIGIEPAMGCDTDPTLKQIWVGGPTSYVLSTSSRHAASRFTGKTSIELMLDSAGDGGGRNTR